MMTDIQREVAVHLLANALRRLRSHDADRSGSGVDIDQAIRIGPRRGGGAEAYLRGMIDLLRALYGSEAADELHRAARAFERSMSSR